MMPGSSVAEQVTVNHLVAGSIPARAAIFQSRFIVICYGIFYASFLDQNKSQKKLGVPLVSPIFIRHPACQRPRPANGTLAPADGHLQGTPAQRASRRSGLLQQCN